MKHIASIVLVFGLITTGPALGQDATPIKNWVACTLAATDKLAKGSDEPAETIVVGVFGACSDLEETYYLDMLRSSKMSVAAADKVKASARAIAHDHIVEEILALRAKIKSPEQ
jgi:hypothetical protein